MTAIQAIGDQAQKDLGFKVTMQAAESSDLLNRFLTQSANIDIADVSLPYLKYLVGRNVLQTIPVGKFKNWDATYSVFTKSVYPGRAQGLPPRVWRPTRCFMRPTPRAPSSPPTRPSS